MAIATLSWCGATLAGDTSGIAASGHGLTPPIVLPKGHLPAPHPVPPPPFVPGQIVNSLTLPGYDFNVIEISGQPAWLVVDSQYPIIVPLTDSNPQGAFPGQGAGVNYSTVSNALGFNVTFTLANKTAVDRTFVFAADYYANLRVGFRVLDDNDNVIWQSYQLLVDIPPLAQPVDLTLAAGTTWTQTAFVPILNQGNSVIGPGTYTVEAEVLGSPAFSARSSFEVSYTVGGPIIHPIPIPQPLPLPVNPLPIPPITVTGNN